MVRYLPEYRPFPVAVFRNRVLPGRAVSDRSLVSGASAISGQVEMMQPTLKFID
jgi:hypothetical protein